MISDLLNPERPPPSLAICNVAWPDFIERVRALEADEASIDDEQVWTVLVAYGYSFAEDGPTRLASQVFGGALPGGAPRTWIEYMPESPRRQEGPTHLDLAFGDIVQRGNTYGGIAFDAARAGAGWCGFVEAKWLSDISCRVSYDPKRNQLLRVIENALTFQAETGVLPGSVSVAILTPATFKRHPATRFYGLKFQEYSADKQAIERDLSSLSLAVATRPSWRYPPNMAERLSRLQLHWATYEDLLAAMPASAYRTELLSLARREGSLLEVK